MSNTKELYTLKDLIPTASLRTCAITYCKRRGKQLPTKRVRGVSYCMIDSSTLAWLLRELDNLLENPYHKWYSPCGLQLAKKEILKNLHKGQP